MGKEINPKIAFLARPKFDVYLDTNLFYKDVKEMVENPDRIKDEGKIKFFRRCYHINLYTSILGKAELSRILRSEYGFDNVVIDKFWSKFCSLIKLKVISQIKIDEEIDNMAKNAKLSRGGILNAQHLLLAKEFDLWFVTGDSFIKERGIKDVYKKSLGYIDFRKMVAKECKFVGKCDHTKNCHK